MPRATLPSGIELEYETEGNPSDPTLLLVSGFNSQLISWQDGLVDRFVERRLHVVRFDNRDVGLSSKLDGRKASPMKVLRAMADGSEVPEVPYTLSDMAADGIGLLDHLGVESAHIAGRSMGGMIVQTMAIEHPDRVASLTSIMSSPGDPRVGRPTPEARTVLLTPPARDRDRYIEASVDVEVYSSKRYFDPHAAKALAARAYDRCFYPQGAARQLAAVYASGDRSERLRLLAVPTLVIHGLDDTLITPDAGQLTADLIPGARLEMVADMGHDMPEPLWPSFVDMISEQIFSTATR